VRPIWRPLAALLALALLAGCAAGTMPGETRARETPGVDRPATKAEVNTQLAVAYLAQNRPDLALTKLQRALEEEPNLPAAHHTMALLRARLGEDKLAEEHFRRAISLDPQNPEAHNNFGVFLCGRDRFPEAQKEFEAALANPLYRTPALALENAGLCAQRAGNTEQAEDYFRKALGYNARLPKSLLQMAFISFDRAQYSVAQDYVNRYSKVAPHSAASLWLGIRTARALGDQDQAASYALLLRANFPDSEERKLLEAEGQ